MVNRKSILNDLIIFMRYLSLFKGFKWLREGMDKDSIEILENKEV